MIEYFKFQPGQPVTQAGKKKEQPPSQPKSKTQRVTLEQTSRTTLRVLKPSLIASFMALDPVANDAFEERVAILEYVEGLPRAEAELLAFRRVMAAIREAKAA